MSTSECAASVKPVERSRTRLQKGQSKRKETKKGKGGYQWRHKHVETAKKTEPDTCAVDIDVERNPQTTSVARLRPRRQLLVII